MKKNILVGCIAFLLSGVSIAAENCSIDDVIKRVEQRLDEITSYQVTVSSFLNGDELAKTNIYGKRPDLLKSEMTTPDGINAIVIFGKEYQWIDDGEGIYKLNLEKARKNKEHPFDTAYSASGNGLIEGEDYVGTFKTLLSSYKLSGTCQGQEAHLKGTLDKERFTRYVQGRAIKAPVEDFVAQFERTLGQLTLIVDQQSALVQSYTMTGADKSAVFKADFADYKFEELSDGVFIFPTKKGTKVIDITPEEMAE